MSFLDRDLLFLAVLLPIVMAVLLWRYAVRRRNVARLLGEPRQLDRLGGAGLQKFPYQRLALVVPAAIALGIAAAGPQWGLQAVEGSSSSWIRRTPMSSGQRAGNASAVRTSSSREDQAPRCGSPPTPAPPGRK